MKPTASGFVDVGGARLYYDMAGEGHPLILIHAGIADSTMWDELLPTFAGRFRTIRFDLRGFGRSDLAIGPFSRRTDLYALLVALEIERAHFVGVSMGGALAIDVAIERPDLVSALVAVAPGLSGSARSDASKASWAAIEAAAVAGDLARAVELEMQMWVDGPFRTPEQVAPGLRERVRLMETKNVTRDTNEGAPQSLVPPAIGRLGEIKCPTLIVLGEVDQPDINDNGERLAREVVGARKVVLPGVGHMLTLEEPTAFAQLVVKFLADLPAHP